jgi:hypothetical protein
MQNAMQNDANFVRFWAKNTPLFASLFAKNSDAKCVAKRDAKRCAN